MVAADAIRALCLALPEVNELDHHGAPSFRVGGKIFCTLRADPPRMMVKLDAEYQHNLVSAHPGVVEAVPGYWGRKGSTFIDLASVSETLAGVLLRMAWSRAAPLRLVRGP
ncbi:MAG TPA: MmcQ/YjbR family DNA-binding protein [Caulobacteraceae bacterium]